jgi:Pregnancy-associated plasma protein-A/Secretion system C-terminal sorting domain
MKKRLLFGLPVFLMACAALNAQSINRCASHEYRENELAAHPEYQQIFDQQEQDYQTFLQAHPNGYTNRAVVVIPVVFHVVYNTTAQNISNTRLAEQLQVLNEDYRKLNADASLVPSSFSSLAADCEIQFCLAQQDANGNWTTGIERIQTAETGFSTNDDVKFAGTGGANAWDRNKFLNIWVCNLTGGLLGYAAFPGGPATRDGVVLHYRYTGKTGASAPYNKGRTATHEVGHWLNLFHIWGDDGTSCSGTDNVSDTPNQADEHYGCPSGAQVSCTNGPNGDMWMNYMDYTDDACMYMFTTGQKTRIWSCMNGSRLNLQTSVGCLLNSVASFTLKYTFNVYPSPSDGMVTLDFPTADMGNFNINITNTLGALVYAQQVTALHENQLQLDLSALNDGVYFIELTNGTERSVRKIVIQ